MGLEFRVRVQGWGSLNPQYPGGEAVRQVRPRFRQDSLCEVVVVGADKLCTGHPTNRDIDMYVSRVVSKGCCVGCWLVVGPMSMRPPCTHTSSSAGHSLRRIE